MKLNKRKKRFIIIFILSSVSFLLIILEQLLSYYRLELLGLHPGYAPYNFSYNFRYLFPAMFISGVLSIIALILFAHAWWNIRAIKEKFNWFERLSIVPSFLTILALIDFLYVFMPLFISLASDVSHLILVGSIRLTQQKKIKSINNL